MLEAASRQPDAGYVLGHSEREVRRLMLQAAILRPITERLLRGAGLGPGMRVLDIGCGAGDVSMLAAVLVGASGSIVGIDRDRGVLEVARDRSRAAGLAHVAFRESTAESFSDPEPFDMVVGRYVLIHQADPTALIRSAAGLARPGGVLAFHELGLNGPGLQSLPRVPLWDQVGEWIMTAFRAAAPHLDAGDRLIEHFDRAGLPQPALYGEVIVGGGEDSPLYAWLADTFESVLPMLVKMGILDAGTVAFETLGDRLRAAVVEARSQVVGPRQICAWVRV